MVRQHSITFSRVVKTTFVLFTAALLQSVVSQHIRVFNVVPDILLASAALFGLTVGERGGVLLGFLCGCVADILFRNTPFAMSAVTFAFVAYMCGVFRGTIVHGIPGLSMAVTAIASMIGVFAFAVIAAIFGYGQFLDIRLPVIVVVVGLLNGLFAIILAPFIRWAVAESESTQLRLVRE